MSHNRRELFPPDVVGKNPNSFELLRVWVDEQGQYLAIRTGCWKDPAAWGVALADLAKHISKSYEDVEGLDAEKVFSRIKAGLLAELSSLERLI